jgi:hypothetical protein
MDATFRHPSFSALVMDIKKSSLRIPMEKIYPEYAVGKRGIMPHRCSHVPANSVDYHLCPGSLAVELVFHLRDTGLHVVVVQDLGVPVGAGQSGHTKAEQGCE